MGMTFNHRNKARIMKVMQALVVGLVLYLMRAGVEQLAVISTTMTEIKIKIDHHTGRILVIDNDLRTLDRRVDRHDLKLQRLEQEK